MTKVKLSKQKVKLYVDLHDNLPDVKGDPDKLEQLTPYFVSILSRVNKGRVAKSRSILFLEEQALKNTESAKIAAHIFTRQSVTMAIGNKAKYIEAMLRIQNQYPDIQVPLDIQSVEVRDGV